MSVGHALAWLLAAVAGGSAAQEIVLYQNQNFSGPQFRASESVSDLGRVGFNDRATSATVRGGSWQLCSDSFFRGQCVTLGPGNYSNLGAMGLNNAVSSLREVGWNGGGGGGGGGPSGGSVVLFDSPGMTGRTYTLNGPMRNFEGTGFNDRAASAIINSGTWQLCADADFQSSCEVLGPGQWPNLGSVTGRVSSARPMPTGGGGGSGSGGGGWGGNNRVVLYEGQNFSGRSYTVNADVLTNLGNTGFNDRASSMRVERGYWMFCTDANFMGDCRTFGPGDYPTLSWLSNRISSGRRISNDYPYNAPPMWR
ncbi:MAG TPA: beta/gamma crystallin-related protein [Casimicrobiaceae bacterium]|nr:beta/gamma crystallin-related protein [Casimicrobiaceae bacterium]